MGAGGDRLISAQNVVLAPDKCDYNCILSVGRARLVHCINSPVQRISAGDHSFCGGSPLHSTIGTLWPSSFPGCMKPGRMLSSRAHVPIAPGRVSLSQGEVPAGLGRPGLAGHGPGQNGSAWTSGGSRQQSSVLAATKGISIALDHSEVKETFWHKPRVVCRCL